MADFDRGGGVKNIYLKDEKNYLRFTMLTAADAVFFLIDIFLSNKLFKNNV